MCLHAHTAPLRCRCNGDLCHGATSCETNYKCFREVRYYKEEDYEETRLGCMDTIDQVNLDGVGVCSGKLDDTNSKLRCCDQKDFCNLDLRVSLDVEEVEQPSTGESLSGLCPDYVYCNLLNLIHRDNLCDLNLIHCDNLCDYDSCWLGMGIIAPRGTTETLNKHVYNYHTDMRYR